MKVHWSDGRLSTGDVAFTQEVAIDQTTGSGLESSVFYLHDIAVKNSLVIRNGTITLYREFGIFR